MEKIKYKGQVYIRVDGKDNLTQLADLERLYSTTAEKIEKSYNKAKNAIVPPATRDKLHGISKQLKALSKEIAAIGSKRAQQHTEE